MLLPARDVMLPVSLTCFQFSFHRQSTACPLAWISNCDRLAFVGRSIADFLRMFAEFFRNVATCLVFSFSCTGRQDRSKCTHYFWEGSKWCFLLSSLKTIQTCTRILQTPKKMGIYHSTSMYTDCIAWSPRFAGIRTSKYCHYPAAASTEWCAGLVKSAPF